MIGHERILRSETGFRMRTSWVLTIKGHFNTFISSVTMDELPDLSES